MFCSCLFITQGEEIEAGEGAFGQGCADYSAPHGLGMQSIASSQAHEPER